MSFLQYFIYAVILWILHLYSSDIYYKLDDTAATYTDIFSASDNSQFLKCVCISLANPMKGITDRGERSVRVVIATTVPHWA